MRRFAKASATPLPADPERISNAPHSFRQIRAHQLIGEPKHPIPKPRERPIAASIRSLALSVIPTIDFNDEAGSRRQKIHNEPSAQRHLPLETYSELLGKKRFSEPLL